MKERDCANCIHHTADGCSKWDCEFEAKDLISRADAIVLLTKIVFDEPPYLDSETLCRSYAEEQINALPSAEAEWIPCSERLPNIGEQVIISVCDDHGDTPYHYTCVGWRCEKCWISDNDYVIGVVTAWKPLPKPYREDGEA